MPANFSSATVIVRNSGFLDAEVDQEVVALNIDKGMCYGLNPIGSRIWRLLAEPIRIGDICETLLQEYEVDPATCEQEVINLIGQLHAEDMIRAVSDLEENKDRT